MKLLLMALRAVGVLTSSSRNWFAFGGYELYLGEWSALRESIKKFGEFRVGAARFIPVVEGRAFFVAKRSAA